MLDALGITVAGEREAYFTDAEYAAAILGVSTEALAENAGQRPYSSDLSTSCAAVEPPAGSSLFSSVSLPWLRRQAFVLGMLAAAFSFAVGAIVGAAAMFVWLKSQ